MTITIPLWVGYVIVGLYFANGLTAFVECILRWQTARIKRTVANSKIRREIEDSFEARHPELAREVKR